MEKIEIKTQTAVEWLEDSLKLNLKKIILECDYKLIEDLFKQAKVKEREQIRSAYIDGQDDIIEQCKFKPEYHLNSLHYYQKKYESS